MEIQFHLNQILKFKIKPKNQNTMAQTVIGIFNSEAEAQKAVQQLENDGFNRSYIDISHNTYNSSGREDVNAYDESRENDSFGDKVNRFFSNLFGDDDDNTRNYAEAAR